MITAPCQELTLRNKSSDQQATRFDPPKYHSQVSLYIYNLPWWSAGLHSNSVKFSSRPSSTSSPSSPSVGFSVSSFPVYV